MDDIAVPKSADTVDEQAPVENEATGTSPLAQMIEGRDLPQDILFVSLTKKDASMS
jgi:hypothetical protein